MVSFCSSLSLGSIARQRTQAPTGRAVGLNLPRSNVPPPSPPVATLTPSVPFVPMPEMVNPPPAGSTSTVASPNVWLFNPLNSTCDARLAQALNARDAATTKVGFKFVFIRFFLLHLERLRIHRGDALLFTHT